MLKTICSTEWMRKSHRVQKMMTKRGAGGKSVLNIPIKYNKQGLITTLLSFPLMLVRKRCQLTPGRPYPMHDRSF